MTYNREREGIRKKLLGVVLFPVTVFGIIIVIFGMSMLYSSYTQGIRDELESTTNSMIDSLEFAIDGDYSFKDNSLYKGNLNITNSTMLHSAKEISQIDTTIFWHDTRIITTLEDKQGVSAVGTKANPDVVQAVIGEGKNYYSDHLNLNGMEYVGYYTPLKNSDDTIIGMVFAGKSKSTFYNRLQGFLTGFLMVCMISIFIALALINSFSGKMVNDIDMINDFLKNISEGNLGSDLDERVQSRDDELGSIGLYAVKMRDNLKNMIERDPLTKLFNRRSVNNKLKRLENNKSDFCIVMCDVDWFKKVNDTYGHEAGDYILVMVSNIIKKNVDGCGFAGRWGGEEFLLIYQLSFEETLKKVEQIKETIEDFDFNYQNIIIKITMTFGIESENEENNYEKRIKKADDRLYIGKSSGRNIIVYKDNERAG